MKGEALQRRCALQMLVDLVKSLEVVPAQLSLSLSLYMMDVRSRRTKPFWDPKLSKSKNGRSRPRKPFISRVFCAQRGIETMVSDHGLGRGQTRSRQDDNKSFDNKMLSISLGLIASIHKGLVCFEKASVLPPIYIATKATWSKGIARLTGTIYRYLV